MLVWSFQVCADKLMPQIFEFFECNTNKLQVLHIRLSMLNIKVNNSQIRKSLNKCGLFGRVVLQSCIRTNNKHFRTMTRWCLAIMHHKTNQIISAQNAHKQCRAWCWTDDDDDVGLFCSHRTWAACSLWIINSSLHKKISRVKYEAICRKLGQHWVL